MTQNKDKNKEEGKCPFCHHTLIDHGIPQYSPRSYDWLTHLDILKCTRSCHSCGCEFRSAYGYKFYNSRVLEPGRDSAILDSNNMEKIEEVPQEKDEIKVEVKVEEKKEEKKEEPIPPVPVSDVPVEEKVDLTITSPWLEG